MKTVVKHVDLLRNYMRNDITIIIKALILVW